MRRAERKEMVTNKLGLPPKLAEVTDYSSDQFAECMAILRESIPQSEQLPEEQVQKLLARRDYRLFSVGERGEIAGMALVYFSSNLPFALLDYMAVRADLRSRGLGSELFREIVGITQVEKSSPDWLLLEVDDDHEGSPEAREINRRRIEFYRRLGARLLVNVPYRFPSVVGPPVPMRLMVRGLSRGVELSAETLRAAIGDIFLNVHGRGGDDPIFQWFVSNQPESLEMR